MSPAEACDFLVCSNWPALVHIMTKEEQRKKQVDLGLGPTLAKVHHPTLGNVSEPQSPPLSE